MQKISLPAMGEYSQTIADELSRHLGWDIVPTKNTTRSLELGAKYLNELMCLPAKSTLGNMIEACEKGASHLLMFDSCGLCRLKAYWILQQKALDKLGYNAKVYPIRLGLRTPSDIRKVDPSVSYSKAWLAFARITRAVARQEPQQPIIGTRLCIGVVGEIFTLLDEAINHRLFDKLRKLGCFVHNSLPLSYFVFKGLYRRGWMKRQDMDNAVLKKAERLAHETFPKQIGGHGNESIIHTIYYGLMGYDGVIHVAPLPCMPEFTVSSVIDEVAHNYNLPLMHLTFDTHTADTGIITRLEAFTDMLRRKQIKRLPGGE